MPRDGSFASFVLNVLQRGELTLSNAYTMETTLAWSSGETVTGELHFGWDTPLSFEHANGTVEEVSSIIPC